MDFSSLLVLPVVLLTRDLDWTDPTVVNTARIAFVVSQVVALICWFVLRSMIKSKHNTKTVQVKATPSMSNPQPDPNAFVTMTIEEYDLSKVAEGLQQAMIGSLIIGFLHYNWGYGVPLIIQCVTVPMNFYKNHLVKDHFLGQTVVRPFPPPPSPFSAFTDALQKQEGTKTKADKKKKKVA